MSMVQRPDLVGQQFGSYRLLRLLGAGGFAEVYLGEHIDLGTQAAIKVLHTQLSSTDIDTFRTEARTIARLLHPHIIRVLDFNAAGSTPFLVMDYAAGGTMRERYPRGTIVPLATIVSYIQQVAEALQYAHSEKLIHRDIKPENILLDLRHNILLSDFGIALVAQSSRYQNTQDVIGTAAYMSPEQIQGKPRAASDQYSLGIVVYEWLSGTRPFEGSLTELWSQHMFASPPPLREKMPTISREVEHVVMTALAKDPKQRFESVRAFATALQQASEASEAQTITSPRPQLDPTIPASQPAQSQIIVSLYPQTNTTPSAKPSSDIRPQGSLKWSFPTGKAVTSSPTVVNSVVYFGSGDRYLYALDAASGQKIWSFRTGSAPDSSPTVFNGVVYFGSDDGNLYAFDAISRQEIWVFRSNNWIKSMLLLPTEITLSPTVINSVVYFSYDQNIYALDATSGQKKWFFRSSNVVTSSPTVANGVVYFGSGDGNLYAIYASSGQKKWSFRSGDAVGSSPTVANGVVYFGSGDGNLYAVYASSGQKKWSFRSGDAVGSSPTVVNGVVYFGSYDGSFYALDVASGEQKWSLPTGDVVDSSPIVINGIIYFGSSDHNIYALNSVSGQKIWSFQTGDRVRSSPAVVGGVVYVGSDDGNLYAIFA
jgi:eukaryotic-like serine/threonine-protein kinase